MKMATRMWKDGTRRGIVYVEGRESAQRVLEAAGKRSEKLPQEAMAEYRDRKGRPFAWQIAFDIGKWDQVAAVCQP
ncbi:MAG: hypothetical protein OHK0029_31990 [Armatimonadaceae bacterium]